MSAIVMKTVRVTTAWTGSGTRADPYRPKVADDHPFQNWEDVSGATPPTGSFSITGTLQDTDYTALLADPNYSGKVTLLGST